ncbi:TauD/TfdA family dioxygenase [Pigmentiphaga soli]|uniref:TauD/TfdA family dioxygenase n=2 Tax=Pigmentiphaga soli TaxID=1007095 RepID=A0ABP8HMP3_9BURK
MGIRFAPLTERFGAEITQVQVKDLRGSDMAALIRLLAERGVVVARGQDLAPEDFIVLMKKFGPLEFSIRDDFHLASHPDIYVISNIVENGKNLGNPYDGFGWHTDMAFCERPTAYTALYSLEVPAEGADTLFSSAFDTYERLPVERQEALSRLTVRHSHDMLHATRKSAPPLTEEQRARAPDVFHPLVRTHPMTGRKAVYLSSKSALPLGMPEPEGRQLIDELVAMTSRPENVYAHKWQVRDLVIWDNRGMLHCATEYDRKKYRRLLYRLTVGGEKPF